MAWESYNLDQAAHDLVLKYKGTDALNQGYKMRMTVAYGLERFWGEQLRLQGSRGEQTKADYWRDTWIALVGIMKKAGVNLPNDQVSPNDTKQIQAMADKLWNFDQQQRKVAIAVLTQLTESMVWWTQRYK
ncbi:MAG: hypothetical protein GW795_13355 [Cyanobacteria bacterium]|nr:hypothetical protein [Cyanobacteria bacterium CG_2015-16_32_12]NCO77236.1 hypothetical protein [Cyanobacteria bacterium CG_2015-22_32_23]NCQ03710.1 hypothetical protein [Cyanobacteria bacterium CG_2015-09_32_10]NCQ42826.1 hypothetical protein [Cyanobacteria bacterium CG_2015-04_32_10]NCS86071.1 hypothetical protein [Cyanobacteria bacterium CG_2015-02_32_10]